MVFSSLIFLYLFLPACLLLYYAWNNRTYRNALLTLFSLVFYAWGEPIWVILLVFSATLDYSIARLIEHKRGTIWAKAGLWSSVSLNLGLLFLFKYSSFIYENVNLLLGTSFSIPQYALPIGISFYTFQTISYVLDVYRNEVPAQRNYLSFLLFVSLFHQLVAGPIVRYVHIADEIDNRKFDIADIAGGVHRFCIGLFKKVCIANIAGELVVKFLGSDLSTQSIAGGWFGLLMFTLQIYFDFSGYSDMAIGMGRMFGFHYHENFDYPYISRSSAEFWRRWHISLGSFFRDYVYIPLGGKSHKPYRNLFVVWLLTGFWHGASWNFILWGLYFGILIGLERLFLKKFLDTLPRIVSHCYLLFAVMMGWALFYFTDLYRLGEFLKLLFGGGNHVAWNLEISLSLKEHMFWLIIALVLCTPVYLLAYKKGYEKLEQRSQSMGQVLLTLANILLLMGSTAMLVGKSYNPFLYFRF